MSRYLLPTIEPDNPVDIDVIYQPTTEGENTTTLNIESNGRTTFNGIFLRVQEKIVNSLVTDFDKVELDPTGGEVTTTVPFRLGDPSGRPVIIETVELHSDAFFIVDEPSWTNVNLEITSDNVAIIEVGYDPDAGSEISGMLEVYHNGANASPLLVTFCVPDDRAPEFAISATRESFSYIKRGSSDIISYTVVNNGDLAGTLEDIIISSGDFTIISPNPVTLEPMDSLEILVEYVPSEDYVREITEKMEVVTSANNLEVDLTIPCSGNDVSVDQTIYEFDVTENGMAEHIIPFGNINSGDPILITGLEFKEGSNFTITDFPTLPLCLDLGDATSLTIVGQPIEDPDESVLDDELLIEYNGGDPCGDVQQILLRIIGTNTASIESVEPNRSGYRRSLNAIVRGLGFADVVDVFFIRNGAEEMISSVTRSREQVELIIPDHLSPGIYDIKIVAGDGSHQDLVLKNARPPRPLANAEVVIRETEKGGRVATAQTSTNGVFEIELDDLRDNMWIEASIQPAHAQFRIPVILNGYSIRPFEQNTDYELNLAASLSTDIYDRFLQLDKLEVVYTLPLLTPLIIKKIVNDAYDINPVIQSMLSDTLFENRCCQEWKNRSLERIDLGLKSTKAHMDLMSQLSPELASSMSKLFFTLFDGLSHTRNLRSSLIAQRIEVKAELSRVGLDSPRRSELLAEFRLLNAAEGAVRTMLKIFTDIINKEVDAAILRSFPNQTEAQIWRDTWRKAFDVSQKLLLSKDLSSAAENIIKAALQDAIAFGADQLFRRAYFSFGSETIGQIAQLSSSGFEADENRIIELAKNVDANASALKDLSDVAGSLAVFTAVSSGGVLTGLALELKAVAEILEKISLASTVVIPAAISAEMIRNHNSLNTTLSNLKSTYQEIKGWCP